MSRKKSQPQTPLPTVPVAPVSAAPNSAALGASGRGRDADHAPALGRVRWLPALFPGNATVPTAAVAVAAVAAKTGGPSSVAAPRVSNAAVQPPPELASRPQPPTTVGEEMVETAKLLAAGGLAGAVSKSSTAPLARLTILYQVQGLQTAAAGAPAGAARMSQIPMREAFMQIVRREGVKALWKGNGATMLHRLPYSAINFWAYERFTELWQRRYPHPRGTPHSHRRDVTRRLAAGGAAGMCACTVAYPLDLLRTRLAAQTSGNYYLGIGASLRTIVRDEGARGLYRGLGATLIQVAPSLAINYCAYETLRSYWMSYQPERAAPTVPMSLLCGSFAGLVSSTATFPLDLARRRLQLEGQRGAAAKYHRYSDVFREIVRKDGLRGLYCGIIPEYAKVIPGVAIAFCSYELMKKLLKVRVNVTNR